MRMVIQKMVEELKEISNTPIWSAKKKKWKLLSNGNSFLKALIYNYVNQEGEKRAQIGIWITNTIRYPN